MLRVGLPKDNMIETADGASIKYDYVVIATGPVLALHEVEGLGPDGFTNSICASITPRRRRPSSRRSARISARSSSTRRAGRLVLGLFILETELGTARSAIG